MIASVPLGHSYKAAVAKVFDGSSKTKNLAADLSKKTKTKKIVKTTYVKGIDRIKLRELSAE